MSVKNKALELKSAVKWKQWQISRPALMKTAALGIHFLLGFVTGCVRVFESAGPFGVAMAARSGGGAGGLVCMLGAAAGYVISGGAAWSIRYLAALVLVYTTAFVFRDTELYKKDWFMPVSAGILMAASGALCFFESLTRLSTLAPLLTEAMLTGVGAWLFATALSFEESDQEQEELRRRAGSLLLLCCLLMALSRISIWNVLNIGRFLAVFAVMTAAFGGGPVSGSTAGVVTGVAVDLAAGGVPFYTMCYGFAGLLSGTLAKKGRFLFLLCFIAANATAVFWQWSQLANASALYEVFAASVIFMILPAKVLTIAVSLVQKPALGSGEAGLRRYTARRARDMADAFRELYETVRRSAESQTNDTDVATVYDRAAEAVCANCKCKGECWHRDYVDTLSILNDATTVMRTKGHLDREDLPARFIDKCPSSEAFLAAINMELRALIYRRRLRSRLEENRSAAYGQFQYLAGVLDAVAEDLRNASGPDTLAERRVLRYLNSKDIDAEVAVFRDQSGRLRAVIESARLGMLYREPGYMDKLSSLLGARMCRPALSNQEEGRMVLLEAEPLAVSVGVAAMKKEGEPVSGDRGTYFKTEQGVLCVLLSDGMGSGEQAARESISVVRILERFLRAGVEPGTAMKILNSVMLLKNGESWGYATVDLMCIDLFTGQTGFYKYGAAPSYIRSGKTVRRVKGVSMAAGILSGEGEPPDVVRMRLKPGGVALIASDGVVTKQNDGWLRDMLAGFDGTDTREFARCVIREAGKQYGYTDDMTVLVVRVEERK